MYSVDPVDSKMGLQLICFDKNFSKKTIVQIEVVPEYQLLFSLTDGLIMVHSISTHNFLHLHTALETKGATVFCVNVEKSQSLTGETVYIVRLCVSVKRKLQFWYFKQTTLLKSPDEIELNDIPKSLAWLQNSILVGFKTEYVLYEVSCSPFSKKLKFLLKFIFSSLARNVNSSQPVHQEQSIHV